VITAEQRVKLMELLDMAKLIKNYFPKKAVEISATLELLRDIMEDTREEIKKQIMLLFDKGLHEDMIPHNQLAAAMLIYMQRLQEIQAALELGEQFRVGTEKDKKLRLPDYKAYEVDPELVHTLQESFTHTRPAAFELMNQRFEVKTWHEMLIKTCEFLFDLDHERFVSFQYDSEMRGRKKKIFTTNPLDNRKPHRIKDSGIFVETNLSANSIRDLIIKLLQKYNIKLSDFKVFLRADYSSLH